MMNVEGWTRKSLGSFTQFIKGITYASEDYCKEDEGAIFLTIKCVSKAGGFKPEGIKYYRGVIHENEKLKEGDILISNTDLTRDGDIVGCPIMVPFLGANEVTMSMDLSKLVIDSFQIDSKFLYYKLMTDKVRRFMQDHASGSTVLHLQTKAVPTLELLIPDKKEEQEQIAEVLSTIDRAIAQTEAIIAKQQRIKTGLMQDLLTKGIDENGNIRSEDTHQFKDSAIGRIPVEWETISMEKITTKIVDGIHHKPNYVQQGIPFIVVTDLTSSEGINFNPSRFITEKDHQEFYKRADPKPKDVLVTKDGTLGIARIVPDEAPDFSIFVSVAMLRPNSTKCIPELIWSFFDSGRFLTQLGSLSAGTGLAHIHLEHFRKFLIHWMPVDEQERIFDVLNQQHFLLQNYCQNLEKQKRLKTGLMQDLLTGKVRVTNLLKEKEPASG
jgi:Restriction endonuclease S subunits